MFERENQFYDSHKKEFQSQYMNKRLLIVGDKVIGVFNTDTEALQSALKKYEPNTFLIKKVLPEGAETVQRFYSRIYG